MREKISSTYESTLVQATAVIDLIASISSSLIICLPTQIS